MARQIVVDVIGDKSKFKNTLDAASGDAQNFGSKLKSAMAVAGVAVLAVAAVGAVGTAIFDVGAEMEAMENKAKTVFGESLGTVQAWAAANAEAMGLTKREATGLAAGFADLLIPMGFTREQAAGMSTDVIGLSGALSEWSGGQHSAAEVSDILSKAMLGERDGLKSLGISITEADVQARLLKNGTQDLTGAALEQAKAVATQQLIMEKSTDAQAAYAAGSAEGTRAQARLGAQLNEVKETLIKALYPVLLTVGKFLAENLPGAIKVAGDIFNWLGKNVIPPLGVAFGIIVTAIKAIITIIATVISAFVTMGTAISRVWAGVVAMIKGAINSVIDIINGAIRGINAIQVHIHVGPVNFDFWGLNLGYIRRLHAGGIVPGVPGMEVPAILEAGERVIPRSQVRSSGGDINIYITGPVYGDGLDELADKLATRLRLVSA